MLWSDWATDTVTMVCRFGKVLSFQKSHFKGYLHKYIRELTFWPNWKALNRRVHRQSKCSSAGLQSSRPTASEDLLYGSAICINNSATRREPPADVSELGYCMYRLGLPKHQWSCGRAYQRECVAHEVEMCRTSPTPLWLSVFSVRYCV